MQARNYTTNVKQANHPLTTDFSFTFPLTQKVVRNLRIVTEHVGDLLVRGVGYCNKFVSPFSEDESKYTVDIEFVYYNGTDIKPVLEVASQDTMLQIEQAATHYVSTLFTND